MRAVIIRNPGDTSIFEIADRPSPKPSPGEVVIRVRATSVNRADLLQRRGLYPPPPGTTDIPGLECAGEIVSVGSEVTRWAEGDRVMALLPGGGYAEEAVADQGSVMAMPDHWSWTEGGAFPEVYLTAFLNLFVIGEIERHGSGLVHGGSGGVGSAAIDLCREAGVRLYVTAGSAEKAAACRARGATQVIEYTREDFASIIREETEGRGVGVILDPIGGEYFARNLSSLSNDGTLVVIAAMKGRRTEIDLGELLRRRITVRGSTLRSRAAHFKGDLVRRFTERFGGLIESGALRPAVERVFPLERIEEAHEWIVHGRTFGKVAIEV